MQETIYTLDRTHTSGPRHTRLQEPTRLGRSGGLRTASSDPSSRLYSPECLEGKCCEVHLHDRAQMALLARIIHEHFRRSSKERAMNFVQDAPKQGANGPW